MNRRIAGLIIAMSMVLVALVAQPAAAGPPAGCAAGERSSRDGLDRFFLSRSAVFGSLLVLEGYQNVCRDGALINSESGSAFANRTSGVVRVQLRAQLQRLNTATDPDSWVTIASSSSVNTGVNRTLEVTTPRIPNPTTAFVDGNYRVNVRALVRWSDNALTFHERQTYSIPVNAPPA
jgi:hypothetical protein